MNEYVYRVMHRAFWYSDVLGCILYLYFKRKRENHSETHPVYIYYEEISREESTLIATADQMVTTRGIGYHSLTHTWWTALYNGGLHSITMIF